MLDHSKGSYYLLSLESESGPARPSQNLYYTLLNKYTDEVFPFFQEHKKFNNFFLVQYFVLIFSVSFPWSNYKLCLALQQNLLIVKNLQAVSWI